MKKFSVILSAILLFTVLALGGLTNPSIAATENEGVIRVTGEAVISAGPDQCVMVVGVETKSNDSKKAASENAQTTSQVIEALKKVGLKEEAIKTGSYSIYNYEEAIDPAKPGNRQTVYRVHNSITITTGQLDKVGEILDTATKAGINQVQSVSFQLQNSELVKIQALIKATQQAKVKGEAIAKGAGLKIKGIKSISEDGTSYSPYRGEYAKQEAMMDNDLGSGALTPIVPGKIEISARVTAEYIF